MILLDVGNQVTEGLGPYFRIGGISVARRGRPSAVGKDGAVEVSFKIIQHITMDIIGGGQKGGWLMVKAVEKMEYETVKLNQPNE